MNQTSQTRQNESKWVKRVKMSQKWVKNESNWQRKQSIKWKKKENLKVKIEIRLHRKIKVQQKKRWKLVFAFALLPLDGGFGYGISVKHFLWKTCRSLFCLIFRKSKCLWSKTYFFLWTVFENQWKSHI